MQARMTNPAMVVPGAMQAIQGLFKATGQGGVPPATLELVHLRASQINGCSACVDSGARSAKKGHYDEHGLAAVILMIAVTNLFNRLNATTRQVAGAWG